jgi:hypothetical protein
MYRIGPDRAACPFMQSSVGIDRRRASPDAGTHGQVGRCRAASIHLIRPPSGSLARIPCSSRARPRPFRGFSRVLESDPETTGTSFQAPCHPGNRPMASIYLWRRLCSSRIELRPKSPRKDLQLFFASNPSRWRPVDRFHPQRPDLQGDVLPISPSLAHRYLLEASCVSIWIHLQNLDAQLAERHRNRATARLPLRVLSSTGHAPARRIRFRMSEAVGDPDAHERRDSLFVPHQRSIIICI